MSVSQTPSSSCQLFKTDLDQMVGGALFGQDESTWSLPEEEDEEVEFDVEDAE